MKKHTLINTLLTLTGNPRACVYAEPLWGIPFNLYTPYVSVYMLALGLADTEIGLIVSISWGFQVILALLSGAITDKMGRRLTTLIFDILAWSVPALISAVAQNFWYFLAAAIINSIWRITHNSWTCLLVEDAEKEQLVDIFTWIHIAVQLVGLAAPVAGIIIGIYSLVPTMRGLYIFATIMFTIKAVVTYLLTEETEQGKVRLEETRQQSVFQILSEYKGVVRDILHMPKTLFTAAIMVIISITQIITGSFWAIILTEKLHIPNQHLAFFPFIRSAIILIFFFALMPRIAKLHFKTPMIIGFLGYVLSQVLLITAPELGYGFLITSSFLEACSFAVVSPLIDQMVVLTIEAKERARIQSILYVGIILITAPFGWIAGQLSEINKGFPFVLNIGLFTIGAFLAYFAGQVSEKKKTVEI
ncbi:MAG: MFS transporter [Chloroflexi bacterium]|nr:MFS transporter [Chloroflexota bacterium]